METTVNGKKHMVIDLVANDWINPHRYQFIHPMRCKIIDAETGIQVGLVQKLELLFEIPDGEFKDGRVTGRMWKYDVTNPGTPDYDINFDEVIEYAVTVRKILENPLPREEYTSEEDYIADNRSAVLSFETGEQHKVATVHEKNRERVARCDALLKRRGAASKAAREAAREAGVTPEMEHEAFVADLVADAEKMAGEGATASIHSEFMESPLCQKKP